MNNFFFNYAYFVLLHVYFVEFRKYCVLFSPLLFKHRIETLNIGGAVTKTQCLILSGVLWYQEMSQFYHWRQIFLVFYFTVHG